jgi:hypothetical protein
VLGLWGLGFGLGLHIGIARTALTLGLNLLEGRRVGCSDEARGDGTLDRELRLAERVQLRVHAVVQVSRRLLALAGVDART